MAGGQKRFLRWPDHRCSIAFGAKSFPVRGYKRLAMKVADVCGNESTAVRELS